MEARIFAVKHFAVHDGPGIRTTVFFKGCPLACRWCHNPEGRLFEPQLAYYAHKCLSCGECVPACPEGAHAISAEGHVFDRSRCRVCGQCASACLGDALEAFGRTVTVNDLMREVESDRAFYETSGGGVTLSGGECLAQAAFCEEFLKEAKQAGYHTCVDTCGFVPREAIERVRKWTDLFLYDIKAADPAVHKRCTGQENGLIWENLAYLTAQGSRAEIRFPMVPGYNDGEVEEIARRLSALTNLTAVRVLPYHNFSGSKYASLAMENTMPDVPAPTKDELRAAVDCFRAHGLNAVCDALE